LGRVTHSVSLNDRSPELTHSLTDRQQYNPPSNFWQVHITRSSQVAWWWTDAIHQKVLHGHLRRYYISFWAVMVI